MLLQHYFLQPLGRFYSPSGFCFRYVCWFRYFHGFDDFGHVERFFRRSDNYHVWSDFWFFCGF